MNQQANGRTPGQSFIYKVFSFCRQEIILLARKFAAAVRKDSCGQESLPPSAGRFLGSKKVSLCRRDETLAFYLVRAGSGRFSCINEVF